MWQSVADRLDQQNHTRSSLLSTSFAANSNACQDSSQPHNQHQPHLASPLGSVSPCQRSSLPFKPPSSRRSLPSRLKTLYISRHSRSDPIDAVGQGYGVEARSQWKGGHYEFAFQESWQASPKKADSSSVVLTEIHLDQSGASTMAFQAGIRFRSVA